MLSIVFVIAGFTALVGITLIAVESHHAPLMADDEVTVIARRTDKITPFNQKALELLKDTAILAQQQELDELIIVASTAGDSTIQVMTGTPVSTLAKLIATVTTSTEQLGSLLQADTESLEVLKKESEKLQQSLAKL